MGEKLFSLSCENRRQAIVSKCEQNLDRQLYCYMYHFNTRDVFIALFVCLARKEMGVRCLFSQNALNVSQELI